MTKKSTFLTTAAMVLCLGTSTVQASGHQENPFSFKSMARAGMMAALSLGQTDAFKFCKRPISGNAYSKYSDLMAQNDSNDVFQATPKTGCPISKVFGGEEAPFRLKLPFMPGLIFVSDPSQIDDIVDNPNVQKGLFNDPKIPNWLNWLSSFSARFVVCPVKHQGAVFTLDNTDDAMHHLNVEERLRWAESIPMMSEKEIKNVVDFLLGEVNEQDMRYNLLKSIMVHFTKLEITPDLAKTSLRFSRTLPPYWGQADARKKIIEWSKQASEQYINIETPSDTTPGQFRENLVPDLLNNFIVSGAVGDLLQSLKQKLEGCSFHTTKPEELAYSVLISKSPLPAVLRVAKQSFNWDSAPYKIEKGDVFFLLLNKAQASTKDIKYTFLDRCCGRFYVQDLLERSARKAIEEKAKEVN